MENKEHSNITFINHSIKLFPCINFSWYINIYKQKYSYLIHGMIFFLTCLRNVKKCQKIYFYLLSFKFMFIKCKTQRSVKMTRTYLSTLKPTIFI